MRVPNVKCRAKSKRTGERCNAWAVTGKDLCQKHGGADGSGGDGRPIVHGLYSNYVPDDWKADYEYFKTDPHILSLKSDIAVARVASSRFRQKIVGQALTAELCDTLLEHGIKIGKLCEIHSKIQFGERVIYSPETWQEMMGKVVTAQNSAIDAVIADPKLRDRLKEAIAERLEKK
ncbi:MAG: hypothetical protein WC455_11810 [Dehalococcoidia bacterium]|jgi:hypothetical protein